jgi:TonB family protein
MGRFFDALQRSQAERSGVELSALPGATDSVENAEQDAALAWEIALKGHGKNIAQVYFEENEPPGATELTEGVEQEAALKWETAFKGLGKNIAQADFENNESPGATELTESVEQEAALHRETALTGLGKNIAQADSGNYAPPGTTILASANARTAPAITWPTPDPITYGNELTFAQLNATASVEGTFVYTPDPGYVLPVGTHTLWVKFTPADSGRYAPRQVAVSIAVVKATPALSWPKPAAIVYGAALDDDQLNALAPVPGSFDYSPAPGEVLLPGRHTLSVTFTPADSANYAAAQASVSLTVARATSVIQWPTPDPITYGTQLSDTQLCAVASIPGTFEYNPCSGSVLAAGEHELSAVFTPADTLSYSASHTAALLTVSKATPALTWPTPDPIACGAAISATQLNATAAVPGSFVYSPAAGEILAPGVHELSVTFTPIDTLNYTTARAVVPLTITEKLPTTITWPVPSAISYGIALSAAQLNATASVPGTFVYTPSEGHVLARGKYTLSASFTPSDTKKYATAQATVVLQVEGLTDVASSPAAATETPAKKPISAIDLAPEDFHEWDSEASPAATPLNSREEWEASLDAHSFSEKPKPLGPSVDRDATPASLVDMPRVLSSASPAPVFVKPQELTNELGDGSPKRASHKPKTRHTTLEFPVAPVLPNAAKVAEIRKSPEPTATLRREADEAPYQLFSSYKIKVKGKPKTAKMKWIAIAAVSAGAILLPLIFIIPQFHLGTKSVAKPFVQPLPPPADTQPSTDATNPPAREPLAQENPPATTEKPRTTGNQPASGVNPAPVPTAMMNDQLTAPTRIPKQEAESAPPTASIDTASADGLGGGGANVSVFNGHSQPNVKVAASKPVAISSGVATGMLIQSTPPDYPPIAKTAHVAGTVELHATIATNGTIKDLHAVSGPIMLRQAALDAVRNWRYKPYRLNNQPVEVETTINVVFALGR